MEQVTEKKHGAEKCKRIQELMLLRKATGTQARWIRTSERGRRIASKED